MKSVANPEPGASSVVIMSTTKKVVGIVSVDCLVGEGVVVIEDVANSVGELERVVTPEIVTSSVIDGVVSISADKAVVPPRTGTI